MSMIVKRIPRTAPEEPDRRYVGPLPIILISLVGIVIIGMVGLFQGADAPYRYEPDQEVAERLEVHLSDLDSDVERAAMRGVLWTVRFVQPEEHFEDLFSDYLLMLHEHQQRARDETARRCLTDLIRNAVDRAEPRLTGIFPATPYGAWDCLTILRILWTYGGSREAYESYYSEVLALQEETQFDVSFEVAVRERDFETLGAYLVDAAFVHHLHGLAQAEDLELPDDHLAEYVQALADLEYVHTAASDPMAYSNQCYFATHVVLALSDYGLKPLEPCRLTSHTVRYLQEEFEPVWRRVPDVDLLAEFVQCLEIAGLGDKPLVRRARHLLVTAQHADGSWGSAEDLAGGAYRAFHPTWTVSTAIMQGAAQSRP